jgi:hypothetical protein
MPRLVVGCSNTHLGYIVYITACSISSGSCTWSWWLVILLKDEMHFFNEALINMVMSNLLFCQVMSITSILYGSGHSFKGVA